MYSVAILCPKRNQIKKHKFSKLQGHVALSKIKEL